MNIPSMRFIFFCFFLLFLDFSLKGQVDIWEKEANLLFDKHLYSEAKKHYDTLYKRNFFSEKMLYRLAYIAEREGNYPEVVYYLRKVQQKYGGEQLNERIAIALENTGSGGIVFGNNNSFYDAVMRNTTILLGIILFLTLFSLYLVFRIRNKSARFIGVSILILCILPEVVLVQAHFLQKPQAIIMRESAFYESSSFAAVAQPTVYAPGTSCQIVDKQDIWYKIEVNQKSYWLPSFVLRML